MHRPCCSDGRPVCFHLVNTSTLVIARQEVERFLRLTGHVLHVVEVPAPHG